MWKEETALIVVKVERRCCAWAAVVDGEGGETPGPEGQGKKGCRLRGSIINKTLGANTRHQLY